MALSTTHPALRWAVPGAVVAIVLGAAAVTAVAADTAPTLPPRTAAELLVDVQNASVAALSGTVVQTADLGLPELPVQTGGRGSSDFTSLVSGTHTLRVWYDGDDQQRLALLGTLGESDIVRNGTDVWTWSSQDNAATHYQLPTRPDGSAAPDPSVPAYTPQQAADAALAAIDPTTNVTTDGTATVAGRAAYELVLTPKDDRSLIGEVRIAIDGEQHIPLRVQVTAKGAATPAFEVGFTQISFDTPDAAQFTFTPPPGATVTDSTRSGRRRRTGPARSGSVAGHSRRPGGRAEGGRHRLDVGAGRHPADQPGSTDRRGADSGPVDLGRAHRPDRPGRWPSRPPVTSCSPSSGRCRRSAGPGGVAGCCSRRCSPC